MKYQKFISVLLAGLMMIPIVIHESKSADISVSASAEDELLYYQWDERWKTVKFTKYAKSANDMYTSGCGIFSFCNAIHALNGIHPDAVDVAGWGVKIGAYKPGAGGLYRYDFYDNIESAYGQQYRFHLEGCSYGKVTDARFIKHLQNGGVAVIHVASHFMAISDYNPENHTYYVLESAPSKGRGLQTNGWVPAKTLLTAPKTTVDWYALLSNTPLTGDINADNQLNAEDIILLQSYLQGHEIFTKKQHEEADINKDSEVNIYDLVALKRVIQEMQVPVEIEDETEETES